MVSLLLQESATLEVAAVHVSHEFPTLGFQTSPKGFSESFWGHLWPIIKQVKEVLLFGNRTALPVYVFLWIFSAVIVETFFAGFIYKRCFDSRGLWVVCVSGSAHSALPAAAPSFSLLSPPILCTVPRLSPSSLPPGSLPPTCWLRLPTPKEFAGSTAVLGGRKPCSGSRGSSRSSELHEDTDYLSTCFREVQII